MSTHPLADAIGHHAWATIALADACAELTDEQLATTVPGTYGSILDTMRHLTTSDSWYLHRLGFEATPLEDEAEAALDVAAIRALAQRHAELWQRVVDEPPDPDEDVSVHRDDGTTSTAPKGLRLAQGLHHGTDHRSQVCTALTSLGIEPPEIDVWAYGMVTRRLRIEPAAAGRE